MQKGLALSACLHISFLSFKGFLDDSFAQGQPKKKLTIKTCSMKLVISEPGEAMLTLLCSRGEGTTAAAAAAAVHGRVRMAAGVEAEGAPPVEAGVLLSSRCQQTSHAE